MTDHMPAFARFGVRLDQVMKKLDLAGQADRLRRDVGIGAVAGHVGSNDRRLAQRFGKDGRIERTDQAVNQQYSQCFSHGMRSAS